MEKNMAKLPSESGDDSSRLTSGDSLLSQGLNAVCNLRDELIAIILSCLPVKSLLRFKCVSKPWCSFIESPHFTKMHLKRSIECKTNFGIIIRGCSFYSVHFDSLNDSTAIEIDNPLKTRLYGAAVVGSCDGLLCLFNTKADILLWNPSTRKCQKLPGAPIALPRSFNFQEIPLCGFGYDHLNDDYKLVRIAPSYDKVLDSKVIVYSLKKNLWKQIQNLPYYLRFQGVWGMFVSGALHWVTTKPPELGSYLSIVAFDLGVEKYREFPLPNFKVEILNMTVGVLGGCLSILANYPHDRMDVWVMNEYGVTTSWFKLFSVKQPKVIRRFNSVRPLAYSKSGKDVLLEVDNKKIMWYDLERNKVKNVNIRGIPNMFDVEVYTQSLVQLDDDAKSDGKQQQKQPQEKKKKKIKKKEMDDFLSKGFKLLL